VARANHHVRYPARVQLVDAMNPCRCGHGGLGKDARGRAPRCLQSYQSRVSGPLMDRIDLQVEAPPVSAADLALPAPAEGTAEAAARIASARKLQAERAAADDADGIATVNARAEGRGLEAICDREDAALTLLANAAEAAGLAARGWTGALRRARTVADLESSTRVRRVHLAEALIYRRVAPAGEALSESPRAFSRV
jgi:magnesium chelatase family protein